MYRTGESLDQLAGNAFAAALIGGRRVGEAVAHDPAPRLHRRTNDARDVVRPRGEQEQGFRRRIHRLFEDCLAQPLGQLGAARLARQDDVASAGRKRVGDELHVTRLARAVDAFQGNEAAAHSAYRLSWYFVTARLCSFRFREKWLEPSPRET